MVAQDYARVYRTNSVMTANPGQLVLMLYDGALKAMGRARIALARPANENNRIQEYNTQVVKAQRIFFELLSTINKDAGDGKFANEMDRLYRYYISRLAQANMKLDEGPIIEVEQLFGQIRDAWAEMLRKQDPAYAKNSRSAA